jgi:ADP-ribose pyrophosphatase YjhB (NUDIX family)
MRPFNFCPSCASSLHLPDRDGAARCMSCGREWYRNPAPTVGCALVRAGRALVTVRAREPEKGRFDVPGGFLHVGEDPLAGLRREVREELAVEVDVSHEDYIQAVPHRYGADGDWLLSLGYAGRLVSGEPSPSDDVASVAWVGVGDLEGLEGLDWAWEHDLVLVRRALQRG